MDLVLENREWRIEPGELEVGLGTCEWGVLSGEWSGDWSSEWVVRSGEWEVGSGVGIGDWGQGTGD